MMVILEDLHSSADADSHEYAITHLRQNILHATTNVSVQPSFTVSHKSVILEILQKALAVIIIRELGLYL